MSTGAMAGMSSSAMASCSKLAISQIRAPYGRLLLAQQRPAQHLQNYNPSRKVHMVTSRNSRASATLQEADGMQ